MRLPIQKHVVEALRLAAYRLDAGVVKYPPQMKKAIADRVIPQVATWTLGVLALREKDLLLEIEKLNPTDMTTIPAPKVSPAMWKKTREFSASLLEYDPPQGRGYDPANPWWAFRHGLGIRTGWYDGDPLDKNDFVPTLKKLLTTKAVDGLEKSELRILIGILNSLSSNAAQDTAVRIRMYVKELNSIELRKGTDNYLVRESDKAKSDALNKEIEDLQDYMKYLKSLGAKEVGLKRKSTVRGPKIQKLDIVEWDEPVNTTGLPSTYPLDAVHQGLFNTIHVRLMPRSARYNGSWNSEERTLELVTQRSAPNRRVFDRDIALFMETLNHELAHMVQAIMADSLALRGKEHAAKKAGTPLGPRDRSARRHPDRIIQLHEKYPEANRDELYYLDPIEFFPQIGTAVALFMQYFVEQHEGITLPHSKAFHNMWLKSIRSDWLKYIGGTWSSSTQNPFYLALKTYAPDRWRRAASEGWTSLSQQLDSKAANPVPAYRRPVLSARKLNPDEYRDAHGRCPIGYHYADDKCTKVSDTIKHKAATEVEERKTRTKNFLRSAAGAQKRFFSDRRFRVTAMKNMASVIRKSPKSFAKSIMHVVKEEVHEYREAGKGILAIAKGNKPSDHERKAIRKVVVHLAITAVAAAATSSGLGIAAGVMKGMARGMAFKAVSPVFEKMHLGEEITHIAHLFSHSANDDLLERIAKAKDDDEAMSILSEDVALAMADYLESADLSKSELFNIADTGVKGSLK